MRVDSPRRCVPISGCARPYATTWDSSPAPRCVGWRASSSTWRPQASSAPSPGPRSKAGWGNLRSPAQSFVGRVREVKTLVDALRSRRLLTLVGVGGVGKTRLSLEVAGAAAADFPSGVWVVELAAVDDRDAVLHTTMTVLGASGEAGVTPLESIVDVLREQPALVVIDNAEHVRDAVGELVTSILAAANG